MKIEPKFKKWTEKEFEEFCEDNYIEADEWLWDFIKNQKEVHMEMNENENPTGDLIVIIRGQEQ